MTFAKETKYFALFILLFALFVLPVGEELPEIHVDVPAIDIDLPEFRSRPLIQEVHGLKASSRDMVDIKYPPNWETKNERGFHNNNFSLILNNMEKKPIDVKLRFIIHPRIITPGERNNSLKIYLNGSQVDKKIFRGKQELKTKAFSLEPGTNILSLKIKKCKDWCFRIHKKSIILVAGENITDNDMIFAENWENLKGNKVMVGNSEAHFYNNRSKRKVRIRFKGVSGEYDDKDLQVQVKKGEVDNLSLGKHFEFYQSPAFTLFEGENVIKFTSDIDFTKYKFIMKDLEVISNIKDKIALGKNWFPVENWYHKEPKDYLQLHWMDQNGTLYFYNAQNKTINKSFNLVLAAFNPPKKLNVFANGDKVYSSYINNTVDDPRKTVKLQNLSMHPGENKIVLRSKSGCQKPSIVKGNSDERCLSFALYPKSEENKGLYHYIYRKTRMLWQKVKNLPSLLIKG